MTNTTYIRLLNKAKATATRSYYNISLPVDICDDLRLECGDKIKVYVEDKDKIVLRKVLV